MCELFAMSSRRPSTVNYSLDRFAEHGGMTHANKSGWGIAYYHGPDAFLIREPEPAHDSPWVDFIAGQDLTSAYVIAHVRRASVGKAALHNTHPFRRALAGRIHVFAHNGTLEGAHQKFPVSGLTYRPVGETDSELAFCVFLERLRRLWWDRAAEPPPEDRLELFAEFAADMSALGSANFLYCDGDVLFVHGHRRIHEVDGKLTEPRAPGLTMRDCNACRQDPEWSCDGLKVGMDDRHGFLFASVPLSEEGWEPLPEGTAIAVRRGEVLGRISTL